jgi:hypothetical protein
MEKPILLSLRQLGAVPAAHSTVLALLKSYARPNDKIAELVRTRWLLSVRRGLYIVNPHLTHAEPDPSLIANHLLGPSYVSQDYALAWHGLIPEAATRVTSAALGKAKEYSFHRWYFSYLPIPKQVFHLGISMVQSTDKQTFLMASPTKALCDKLWLTSGLPVPSQSALSELLFDDWRLDEDILEMLDEGIVQAFRAANLKRKLFDYLLALKRAQGH